jgi:hypothetical protein
LRNDCGYLDADACHQKNPFFGNDLGCVDIQVMPAREQQFSALPVLTLPKRTLRAGSRSHHPRLGLT